MIDTKDNPAQIGGMTTGNEGPEGGTTTGNPGTTEDGPARSRAALIARNRTGEGPLQHGLRRRDSEQLRVVCGQKTCLGTFDTCEYRMPGSSCRVAADIRTDCETFVNALPGICSWIKPKRDSLALGRLSEMLYRKEIASILLNKASGGLASALCSKATTAARLLQHLRQAESAVDKLVLSLKLNPNSADTIRTRIKVRGRWVDVSDEGESLQDRYMRLAAEARTIEDARLADNPTDANEIITHEIDQHEVEPRETWGED